MTGLRRNMGIARGLWNGEENRTDTELMDRCQDMLSVLCSKQCLATCLWLVQDSLAPLDEVASGLG